MSVSDHAAISTETAPTVFISYRRDLQSTEIVKRLIESLTSHGLRVWLDEHELVAGQSISVAIDNAIKRTDAVLFVLTEDSTKSSWISFEIAAAIVARQKDPTKLIIPALAPGVDAADIPPLLEQYQGIFLNPDPDSIDRQVERIAESLKTKGPLPEPDVLRRYAEIVGVESLELEVLRQAAHRSAVEKQVTATQRLGTVSGGLIAITATITSALLAVQGNALVAAILAIIPVLVVAFSLFAGRTRRG